MGNYELEANEVILFEGSVTSNEHKGLLHFILSSKKMVFEKEKGIFKKQMELVDVIALEKVKIYNGVAQIKQKNNTVEIQTVDKNIKLVFNNILDATKFTGKIVDEVTKTTMAKRSSEKIKGALDIVDETLGVDSRGIIKGVLENGIKGAIWNGIGKKK